MPNRSAAHNERMPDTTRRLSHGDIFIMNEFPPGAHDFDWYFGTWHVHNRMLQKRLAGSQAWWEFPATDVVKPILGGLGNIDEIDFDRPERPLRGFNLRIFNRDTHLWSIYWVDDNGTALQPPLIGAFENGIGTFFADDTFHGQAIRVRFIWDAITDNSARWEQAFSIDHGAQWEVNWVMRFTRKRE